MNLLEDTVSESISFHLKTFISVTGMQISCMGMEPICFNLDKSILVNLIKGENKDLALSFILMEASIKASGKTIIKLAWEQCNTHHYPTHQINMPSFWDNSIKIKVIIKCQAFSQDMTAHSKHGARKGS